MNIISTSITSQLQSEIASALTILNLKVDNATLQTIINNIAGSLATSTIGAVSNQTNYNLSTIPANTIGRYNPVDIATSNNDGNDLTNVLTNSTVNSLSSPVTNQFVNLLKAELQNILSPNEYSAIDFTVYNNQLLNNSTRTFEGTIASALLGVAESIFGTAPSNAVSEIDFNNIFGELSTLDSRNKAVEFFATDTANRTLTKAENFNIESQENNEKLFVVKTGFSDPTASLPAKDYQNASETNKLAKGEVKGTIVKSKILDKMIGAKLPGGEAWDQPEVPYRGDYPYNKVTQTESGHIIELDDTPGSERLHVYHKSGTFIEIDSTGSVVKRTKGSAYEIIDKNGKIAISGRADVSVVGDVRIFVGNDATIEVEGNTNILCHNDITAQAGGKFFLSANEEFNITSNVVNIQAYDEMHLHSVNKMNLSVDVDFNLKSNTNIFIETINNYGKYTTSWLETNTTYNKAASSIYNQAVNIYNKTAQDTFNEASNIHNKTSGNHYIDTSTLYEKASGGVYSQAGGSIHFKASSSFNVDGATIHLNGGTASGSTSGSSSADSQSSQPATLANMSNIGILSSGRKDIMEVDIDDPVPLTLADNIAILVDENSATAQEIADHHDKVVIYGFITKDMLSIDPVELERVTVTSKQTNRIRPVESLKSSTELPGNYNLSEKFTLQALTWMSVITKDKIPDDDNRYKYGTIVYNLHGLAQNILEPAYAVYPNLIVASAFRRIENCIQSSSHSNGTCVDIMFRGDTKDQVYEKAKNLAKILCYDQFILNYCNYSNSAWIHISYSSESLRNEVMTFWNNEKYCDGLARLK